MQSLIFLLAEEERGAHKDSQTQLSPRKAWCKARWAFFYEKLLIMSTAGSRYKKTFLFHSQLHGRCNKNKADGSWHSEWKSWKSIGSRCFAVGWKSAEHKLFTRASINPQVAAAVAIYHSGDATVVWMEIVSAPSYSLRIWMRTFSWAISDNKQLTESFYLINFECFNVINELGYKSPIHPSQIVCWPQHHAERDTHGERRADWVNKNSIPINLRPTPNPLDAAT